MKAHGFKYSFPGHGLINGEAWIQMDLETGRIHSIAMNPESFAACTGRHSLVMEIELCAKEIKRAVDTRNLPVAIASYDNELNAVIIE